MGRVMLGVIGGMGPLATADFFRKLIDATPAHWKNFIQCVRTREKPVSDLEFGLHVQAALNMAMLSLLKKKVATFNLERKQIVI